MPILPVLMLRTHSTLLTISVSTLLAISLLASDVVASPGDFPRPAGIEPQIRFWTRIYSEIDRGGGLIHDSSHMNVVYEAIRLPKGLSRRSRERQESRRRWTRMVRSQLRNAPGRPECSN